MPGELLYVAYAPVEVKGYDDDESVVLSRLDTVSPSVLAWQKLQL